MCVNRLAVNNNGKCSSPRKVIVEREDQAIYQMLTVRYVFGEQIKMIILIRKEFSIDWDAVRATDARVDVCLFIINFLRCLIRL